MEKHPLIRPLAMTQLMGVFTFLLIGLVTAFTAFIIEHLTRCFKNTILHKA